MIMQTGYGNRQVNAYLLQKINSATPEELAAMLLEGAQRFLHQAAAAIRSGDLPGQARLVNRASLIMDELLSMLNADGGELVDRLHGIYVWWIKEIFEGSRKHQPEQLERVARQMGTIREGWEQLSVRAKGFQTPTAAPGFSIQSMVG
jgi:flagellar secretion chaperone FliS